MLSFQIKQANKWIHNLYYLLIFPILNVYYSGDPLEYLTLPNKVHKITSLIGSFPFDLLPITKQT